MEWYGKWQMSKIIIRNNSETRTKKKTQIVMLRCAKKTRLKTGTCDLKYVVSGTRERC